MALIVVAAVSLSLPERPESIPPRTSFAQGPNVIGPWTGRRDALRVSRVLIQLGNQRQAATTTLAP